nr:MAG TPA: hypothetical protein [Caudoviricetes sp.]
MTARNRLTSGLFFFYLMIQKHSTKSSKRCII